jgi:hypothetical protein
MQSVSSNNSTVKTLKFIFKVNTFPHRVHKEISKTNFNVFSTELRNELKGDIKKEDFNHKPFN